MKEIKYSKRENYTEEYVDETGEPWRRELYKIAKEQYDMSVVIFIATVD